MTRRRSASLPDFIDPELATLVPRPRQYLKDGRESGYTPKELAEYR